MATRRSVEDAVKSDMNSRDLKGPQPTPERATTDPLTTPERATEGPQQGHNRPPARDIKKIRFDAADYDTLQRIAETEGTTTAALVRLAVKELLSRRRK